MTMTHALLAALLIAVGAPPTAGAESAEAVAVVATFNAAITRQALDDAIALLAPGAVQFALRPAHADLGGAAPAGITTDLKAHWTMVGKLLFSMMADYQRVPTIVSNTVEGDLATVWTTTRTVTTDKSGSVRREAFSEVYILVRTADGWRIGGIADNRRGSAVGGQAGQ